MKKRNRFWGTIFTGANGRISSKRVLGTFILIVLLAVLVVCIFTGREFTWLGEAVITMMIGAFALMGIGVFEKRFSKPIPHGEDYAEMTEEIDTTEESQDI